MRLYLRIQICEYSGIIQFYKWNMLDVFQYSQVWPVHYGPFSVGILPNVLKIANLNIYCISNRIYTDTKLL